jgi:hypothetical protein
MNVMKIFIQLVALSICAQLIQHEQNHFTYSAPVHRLSYNVHRLGYNMKTPVLMRRAGSTICLLFAALAAAVRAYGAGADVPGFLRTSAGRLAGWVAADLDGDRHADLASAGISRRDGRAYLQEITIRISGSEASIITVRTSLAAARLSVRDLDGDADRDLVLEGINREPLAVLLNDGDGHFHEGDVEDFEFQLAHRDPRTLESVKPESPPTDAGEFPNDESVAARSSVFSPDLSGARLYVPIQAPRPVFQHSGESTRGPPRSC